MRRQTASRRQETGGAEHAHEIAPRNARGFLGLEEELAMLRIFIQPMRLAHGLHELAKKRGASV